jgi:hypothetical protein
LKIGDLEKGEQSTRSCGTTLAILLGVTGQKVRLHRKSGNRVPPLGKIAKAEKRSQRVGKVSSLFSEVKRKAL